MYILKIKVTTINTQRNNLIHPVNNNLPLPYYFTGITDGEVNFHVAIQRDGRKIAPTFKITQKVLAPGKHSSIDMLNALKQFFNCGSIVLDNKNDGSLKFKVSDLSSLLNIIIPHFDNYPLKTKN